MVPVLATAADFTGQTFALTFTSATNERFTTIPINLSGAVADVLDTERYIKEALEGLPNGVIDSVAVAVGPDADGSVLLSATVDTFLCDELISITFDGDQVCVYLCCTLRVFLSLFFP